jgi:hypothetical protein
MTADRQRKAATKKSPTTKKASTKKATPQKSTAKKSTAKKSTAKKSTAQNSTDQNSTDQNSTAQSSTDQSSTAQNSTDQSSTAQSATGENSTATKSGAKTSAAKNSGAKRSSTSKVTSITDRTRASAPRTQSRPRASAVQVAGTAADQLSQLTGKALEGVTGVERDEDEGWRVTVEVLELRRIPESTDVLALYEVDADEKGNLMGYRRVRRYSRGAAGED